MYTKSHLTLHEPDGSAPPRALQIVRCPAPGRSPVASPPPGSLAGEADVRWTIKETPRKEEHGTLNDNYRVPFGWIQGNENCGSG